VLSCPSACCWGIAASLSAAVQAPEAAESELVLDRPARRLIQQALASEGFDPGTPDGQFGPRTRAAIRAWQAARGAPETGYLDAVQAGVLSSAASPVNQHRLPPGLTRTLQKRGALPAPTRAAALPPEWLVAYCSAEALHARHRFDETTREGLFAFGSMQRECLAAASVAAEPEPEFVPDRPWTAFCSHAAVAGRHPNADDLLLLNLWLACRGTLQAAADAGQPLRRCWYSSRSDCGPDEGCPAVPTPAPHERWLEVPPLTAELEHAAYFARMGSGPWPRVRRCDAQGCTRISVNARRSGAYFTLEQQDGPWFAKMEVAANGPTRFLEVATVGLAALVYRGTCGRAYRRSRP
jgi:hypothetical protein